MMVHTDCAVEVMNSNIRMSIHRNMLSKKIFSWVRTMVIIEKLLSENIHVAILRQSIFRTNTSEINFIGREVSN